MATDWRYLSFREMNHCKQGTIHQTTCAHPPPFTPSHPIRPLGEITPGPMRYRRERVSLQHGQRKLARSLEQARGDQINCQWHSHWALLAGRLPAVPVANCSLCLCLSVFPPLTSGPIVSPGTTGDQTKQARGCLASNQDREVPSRPLSNVPTEVGWSSFSSHLIPSLDLTDPNYVFISPSPRQLFILPLFLPSFLPHPLPLRSTLPTLENTPD